LAQKKDVPRVTGQGRGLKKKGFEREDLRRGFEPKWEGGVPLGTSKGEEKKKNLGGGTP